MAWVRTGWMEEWVLLISICKLCPVIVIALLWSSCTRFVLFCCSCGFVVVVVLLQCRFKVRSTMVCVGIVIGESLVSGVVVFWSCVLVSITFVLQFVCYPLICWSGLTWNDYWYEYVKIGSSVSSLVWCACICFCFVHTLCYSLKPSHLRKLSVVASGVLVCDWIKLGCSSSEVVMFHILKSDWLNDWLIDWIVAVEWMVLVWHGVEGFDQKMWGVLCWCGVFLWDSFCLHFFSNGYL